MERDGYFIEVVDTPGFFDTEKDKENIEMELYRALMLTSPGFDAIAFVMEPGRFTDEMRKLVDTFFHFFGNDVEKFAFIIFTHLSNQAELKEFLCLPLDAYEDKYDRKNADLCAKPLLKNQIKKGNIDAKLYELIMKCGGNITIIENNATEECKGKQVHAIFAEIARIKKNEQRCLFPEYKLLRC